jgi:hypothetical protein
VLLKRTVSGIALDSGVGSKGRERTAQRMALKDERSRLDSETRQWLLDNPGRVLVPAGNFIRGKGTGVGAEPPTQEIRFFDAAQPDERP